MEYLQYCTSQVFCLRGDSRRDSAVPSKLSSLYHSGGHQPDSGDGTNSFESSAVANATSVPCETFVLIRTQTQGSDAVCTWYMSVGHAAVSAMLAVGEPLRRKSGYR
jgi:hypothetical protein